MNIKREWVTPITVGAFLLTAATGILMFFHLSSGVGKFIHEWLSWILVGSVVLHAILNFAALKKYLSTKNGALIVGAFLVILLASFFPTAKKSEPSFARPIRALSEVPLSTLANVAKLTPQQLLERLSQAGIQSTSEQQTLSELTGNDINKQARILNAILDKSR